MMDALQLGDTINCLRDPVALPTVGGCVVQPLLGSCSLRRLEHTRPQLGGAFSPLTATLHESRDCLLNALFEVSVHVSREDLGQRRLEPAMLMPADAAFLKRIGGSAAGYLLFTLDRDDGWMSHDVAKIGLDDRIHMEDYWTPEGRHAMARLRSTSTRLDPDGVWRPFVRQAQMARYLEYFYRYGTHFISAIGYGQRLWQVFALRAERMAYFADHWRHVVPQGRARGALAASFAAFTGSDWCCHQGEIHTLVPEPALPQLMANGVFAGPRHAPLLAAPFLAPSSQAQWLTGALRTCGPLRLQLMSQAFLMGETRARVWQKVLNCALVQRYGGGDDLTTAPTDVAGWVDRGFAGKVQLRAGAVVKLPPERPCGEVLWAGEIAVEPFGGEAVVCRASQGLNLQAGEIDGIIAVEGAVSGRITYGFGLKMGTDPQTGQVIALDDPRLPSANKISFAAPQVLGLLLHAATLLVLGGSEREKGRVLARWMGDMVKAAPMLEHGTEAGFWTSVGAVSSTLDNQGTPLLLALDENRSVAHHLLQLASELGVAEMRLQSEGVTSSLLGEINRTTAVLESVLHQMEGELPLLSISLQIQDASMSLSILSGRLGLALARLLPPSVDLIQPICRPTLADIATTLQSLMHVGSLGTQT